MPKKNQLPPLSDDDWLMVCDAFDWKRVRHYETVFALANGYQGLRGSLEMNPELGDPGLYAAGVFDEVSGRSREIVNLPSWISLRANMDGFDMDLTRGEVLEFKRTLDMRKAILRTEIVYRDPAGRSTRWESARLVHAKRKHAALLWGRLTALDFSGNASLTGTIDAHVVKYLSGSGMSHLVDTEPTARDDAGIAISARTKESDVTVAVAAALSVSVRTKRSTTLRDDKVSETLRFRLEKGRPVEFHRSAGVFTSRESDDPLADAFAEVDAAGPGRRAALVRSHVGAWESFWTDADVRIDGDPRARRAIRFNVFHLGSLAAPEDDSVSIGAKGLHGRGYNGQVFWDTEIYMVPFYTFVDPPAARALLGYRCRHLDEARQNAREVGLEGARFPWNSCDYGLETFKFGWQEHLHGDIALAVDRYVEATGDNTFHRECGVKLILAAAKYWVARLDYDDDRDRYVMHNVAGPDEIHTGIENNAFTNYLVRWHLHRAADAAEALRKSGDFAAIADELDIGDDEPAHWRDVADRILIPFDEDKGFHEQHEGYFDLRDELADQSMTQAQFVGPVLHAMKPTQLTKQADTVLLYYLFAQDFPLKMRKAGHKHYEPRSTHASTLSRSIYAAVAAQVGLMRDAYRLFMESAEIDFGERAENDSGIHAASLGGTWQAVVMGFGGFAVHDGRPSFDPQLPGAWDRLEYSIKWRKRTIEVSATRDEISLRCRGGKIKALVAGEERTLGPRKTTVKL